MNYIIVKNDREQVQAGAITEDKIAEHWGAVWALVTGTEDFIRVNNLITISWPGCSVSQAKALCHLLTKNHKTKSDAVAEMEEWYLRNLIIPVQP